MMESARRSRARLPENLHRRARLLRHLRSALEARGYLEVETPLRVRTPGTDVNLDAFPSEDRWLITSPEFHLKRLLAEGFQRIYQIARCFRRGERTDLHNPEFTMLEFYAAALSLEGMMAELEEIVGEIVSKEGVRSAQHRGITCDLQSPWERLSVDDAFRRYAGWSPRDDFAEDRFYFDLVDKVDRHLGAGKPTILYDYPAPLAMLARLSPEDPRVARRFELYVSGIEIANAFDELTDPAQQRRRFEADLAARVRQNKPLYPIDEALLAALPHMPPSSGIAVGLDRLVMLLVGAQTIDEVMAFADEET